LRIFENCFVNFYLCSAADLQLFFPSFYEFFILKVGHPAQAKISRQTPSHAISAKRAKPNLRGKSLGEKQTADAIGRAGRYEILNRWLCSIKSSIKLMSGE
jgi:hypothetical protein